MIKWDTSSTLLSDSVLIWVDSSRTGILLGSCHFSKTFVAKPDLLRHFSWLFCGEHDFLITLPSPQPLHQFTTMQCNAIKMQHRSGFKSDTKQCILVNFECIAVHCSKWMWVGAEKLWWESHALHKTIEKCGVANQVVPHCSCKVFLSDTKEAKFPYWGNLPIWVGIIRRGKRHTTCIFLSIFMVIWSKNEGITLLCVSTLQYKPIV